MLNVITDVFSLCKVKCQNGSNIISLANVSQDWHHRQRITLIREGPGLGMTVAELCDIYKKVYGKDISKTEVSAYIHHSLKVNLHKWKKKNTA